MRAHHRLTTTSFDAIAAGRPDPAGLSVLRGGQLSKHLLMLRMIADEVRARPSLRVESPVVASAVDASLELLTEAHHRDPPAVVRVLGYPYVGARLARCIRALRRSTSPPLLAQLTGVAAAAAIRAAVDFELAVWPTGATVSLPSVGSGPLRPGAEPVTVRHRASHTTVDRIELPGDPGLDHPGWHGLRQLTGPTTVPIEVVLDDVDPHRAAPAMYPTGHLTQAQFTEWRDLFTAAWRLLCRDHHSWATQLADLLVALTPLRENGPTHGISATMRQAFGAVALTRPGEARGFAAALCHELQHAKLNALLDLVELCELSDGQMYYAPWRADARPLVALLNGTYAFLGVADFWQRRSTLDDDTRARYEFARVRLQVVRAIETLQAADGLTAPGRQFVSGMAKWVDRLFTSQPPEREHHYAELADDNHYAMWRMRNLRPDPASVQAIAEAWRAQLPPPVIPEEALVPHREQFIPSDRELLLAAAALDRSALHLAGSTGTRLPAVDEGDGYLAAGSYHHAAAAYRMALSRDSSRDTGVTRPDDAVRIAAWTGLALARQRTADSAEATIWRNHPELVRALHSALATAGNDSHNPEELARWLGTR